MAEEFIEDIIGTEEPVKTESEMAAEIQGTKVDTPEETKPEAVKEKVETGSEATPDDTKVADDKADELEPDAVKELAAQLGWREDHSGEDAVDAKTYILRSKDIQKSMSQHNKDLKDQLQALGGSVSALKTHNENVYQAEVKRLTAEVDVLKKERRAAIELADVAKVDELDEQIEQKQKDLDAPKPVDSQEMVENDNPAYDEWIKDNDWYLKDDDMAKFADTVAEQYVGAPLERVYALVRNKVQEVFPDKFESSKVAEPVKTTEPVKTPVGPTSPVESSSAKVADAGFTKADLTPDQVQIMNQFVRGGIMTEEQYVNDIAKMQG